MTSCRKQNFNGGSFPNGGPEPPRLWSRFNINCSPYSNFSKQQLDMRRKAEILQYKNNSSNLSKKMKWSQLSRGVNSYNKKTWATQSDTFTNPNVRKLPRVNDTLVCPQNPVICSQSTYSDVPGNTTLCYDKNVPLVNYIVARQYNAGGSKWPQSTTCVVTDGTPSDNCVVTNLAIQ
jgi:hypothetical protein